MQAAVAAQPDWLAQVPTHFRLPPGRHVAAGCGTSFHAAQTTGNGRDSLELVLDPPTDEEVLVLVSHEGATPLTLEAARAFRGPKWLVTGTPEGPIAELCDGVIVATPAIDESYCHTASYTCAVAALAALRGEDIGWRDWPTAQEAALKLREGAYLPVEAHPLEEFLHGHLAAVDETVRCFVLEGEGRAVARAADAVAALKALGCDVTLVPTRHPVVDIVPFQLLTLDLAEARGTEPDLIRRDDPRWQRARDAYS